MLRNTHFSVAVHVLSALAYNQGRTVPSEQIADSVGTNPSFVRQLIGKLTAAGLVETRLGKGGGATLARDPRKITLLDVYRATEKPGVLSKHDCTDVAGCAVAEAVPDMLDDIDSQLTRALETELARTRLSDLIARHIG